MHKIKPLYVHVQLSKGAILMAKISSLKCTL